MATVDVALDPALHAQHSGVNKKTRKTHHARNSSTSQSVASLLAHSPPQSPPCSLASVPLMSDSSSNTGHCSPRMLSRRPSRDLLKDSVSPAQSHSQSSRSRDSSPRKHQHRRSGSKSSLSGLSGPECAAADAGSSDKSRPRAHGHRRKGSSMGGTTHHSAPRRGSGLSVFDGPTPLQAPVPLRGPFAFLATPVDDSPSSVDSESLISHPPGAGDVEDVGPSVFPPDAAGPSSPPRSAEPVQTPRKHRLDPEEDVRARLSSFSFGSKPASRSPIPDETAAFDLLASPTPNIGRSPLISPRANRLLRTTHNTPLSRPPSLLFTHATPSAAVSPTPFAPLSEALRRESRGSLSAGDDALPSSPLPPAGSLSPGPASGRKRHSHTRSDSISMPNLKLVRPGSLGVHTSPSLPGSPNSPMTDRPRPATAGAGVGPNIGSRLKFEPSGRGAEAEKEKEDSRRRTLEKLSGGSPRPSEAWEPREPEISLPELEDDDLSSSVSSLRPTLLDSQSTSSGAFSFGRPASSGSPAPVGASGLGISYGPGYVGQSLGGILGSPSSPTSANSVSPPPYPDLSDLSSPKERWISFGRQPPPAAAQEDGLGLGPLSANGHSEFSPGPVVKRASMTTSLGVVAEVDETEEEGPEEGGDREEEEEDHSSPTSDMAEEKQRAVLTPPTARLRQLHLSSVSTQTPPWSEPDGLRSFSLPRSGGSTDSPFTVQTQARLSGSAGRRPRPLSGISGPVPMPGPTDDNGLVSGLTAAPADTSPARKRAAANSASSRRSSISYKRTEDSGPSPSRDRSYPLLRSNDAHGSAAAPANSRSAQSPSYRSWEALRTSPIKPALVLAEGPRRAVGSERPVTTRSVSLPSRNPAMYTSGHMSISQLSTDSSLSDQVWTDKQLELELERDALQEDVQMWRARCEMLEDRLEAERRESAMLRERVRTLGVRVSELSSARRRPKEGRAGQSSDVEDELVSWQSVAAVPHAPPYPVAALGIPQAIVTPATPLLGETTPPLVPVATFAANLATVPSSGKTASPDPSKKFRAWRLPTSGKLQKSPSPPKDESKRESFFGLSVEPEPATPLSASNVWGGVDLPPFGLVDGNSPAQSSFRSALAAAAVGPREPSSGSGLHLRHSPSTGYIPLNVSPSKEKQGFSLSPTKLVRSLFDQPSSPLRGDELMRGSMDYRKSCKCCIGPVLEL